MKKLFINKYLLTILGIVFFFLLWYFIYLGAGQNRAVFPGPIETIEEAFSYLKDEFLYKCIWGSLSRMLVAFSLASTLGILLGIIVGNVTPMKHVFNPTITALKAIPTAALVYLFLIISNLKDAPIYVVIVIVFPLVYEATVAGYSNVDPQLVMAARVDGAHYFRNNLKIKFPLSLPYIFLGLISSFALAFKIEIMAEVISGTSTYGIGTAIQDSFGYSMKGLVPCFAYSFIAIVIILLMQLIFHFLKKLIKIKRA